MLISQLIQKLEVLKSAHGDVPVHFKDDWGYYPLDNPWVETAEGEDLSCLELEEGQPILCMSQA